MTRKEMRNRRLSRGLCQNCGKRPPKKDCTWCLKCRTLQSLTMRDLYQSRKERGMCPYCGRKARPDYIMCSVCQKKCRDRRAREREKKES